MKKNKVYFVVYDAYGDWLSCNGLIRFLASIYNKVFLVIDYSYDTKTYPRKSFIEDLFKDNPNIYVIKRYKFEIISKYNVFENFDVVDVRYHDNFQPIGKRYNCYFSKKNKIFSNIISYYDNASGFYAILGLDKNLRLDNFFYLVEDQIKIPNENYWVYCSMFDGQIKPKYLDSPLKKINLHNFHSNYLKLINLIANAKKVILIENSIALLIYYLQSNKLIPSFEVDFHIYARNEKDRKLKNELDNNIFIDMFNHPRLQNWNYIYE